jgi:hypothetical protein
VFFVGSMVSFTFLPQSSQSSQSLLESEPGASLLVGLFQFPHSQRGFEQTNSYAVIVPEIGWLEHPVALLSGALAVSLVDERRVLVC